jgi:hypothetical protein
MAQKGGSVTSSDLSNLPMNLPGEQGEDGAPPKHSTSFEQIGKELLEEKTSLDRMLELVSELRERIEVTHHSEHKNFLLHLFPALQHILTVIPPSFTPDNHNKVHQNR